MGRSGVLWGGVISLLEIKKICIYYHFHELYSTSRELIVAEFCLCSILLSVTLSLSLFSCTQVHGNLMTFFHLSVSHLLNFFCMQTSFVISPSVYRMPSETVQIFFQCSFPLVRWSLCWCFFLLIFEINLRI